MQKNSGISEKSEVGVAGLGAMGSNLALNFEGAGLRVSVFNRPSKSRSSVGDFLSGRARGKKIAGFENLKDFAESLGRPRKIVFMVKAGAAVGEVLQSLLPHLSAGDIVVDCGNSDFRDTRARVAHLEKSGVMFVGAGISGGTEGARHGASIMLGGNEKAASAALELMQKAAAKLGGGGVCCAWLGGGGAGHFAKTVHNSIEYALMQLIAETYQIMRRCGKFSNAEIADVFGEFGGGRLGGYLVEITEKILRFQEGGRYVLDGILDCAGQKGSGVLGAAEALENSAPFSCAAEAVFARFISADIEARGQGARIFGSECNFNMPAFSMKKVLEKALFAANIIAYSQGFGLLRAASERHSWNFDLGEIARIWRGGCIIRARILEDISAAFSKDSSLKNLMFCEYFAESLKACANSLREVVSLAAQGGIPAPAFSAALAHFDLVRQAQSPANLIQAQRDFFGAHSYEKIGRPRGEFYHSDWQ